MLNQSSRTEIEKLNLNQAIGAAFGTLSLTLGIFLALLLMNISNDTSHIVDLKVVEIALVVISILIAIFCFGAPAVKLRRYQKTHRKLSVVYPKKEALAGRKHYARNTATILTLIIVNIVIALLITKNTLKECDAFSTYTLMITPIIALAPLLSYNGTRLGNYSDALRYHKNPKTNYKNQDRIATVLCLIVLCALILFAIYRIFS